MAAVKTTFQTTTPRCRLGEAVKSEITMRTRETVASNASRTPEVHRAIKSYWHFLYNVIVVQLQYYLNKAQGHDIASSLRSVHPSVCHSEVERSYYVPLQRPTSCFFHILLSLWKTHRPVCSVVSKSLWLREV